MKVSAGPCSLQPLPLPLLPGRIFLASPQFLVLALIPGL